MKTGFRICHRRQQSDGDKWEARHCSHVRFPRAKHALTSDDLGSAVIKKDDVKYRHFITIRPIVAQECERVSVCVPVFYTQQV